MGNLQVRFLEGWAPAMAPGYSTQPSSTSSFRGRTLFLEGKGAYARFADYAAE